MFRTKLTLAGLAAVIAVGAQAAVAQAKLSAAPSVRPFITDTLAPGGLTLVRRYGFITDTLAPGGKPSPVEGYRFVTDTLAPGGGMSEAPVLASEGFDWGDAGLGAGATAGLMLALLGSVRHVQRRSAIAV